MALQTVFAPERPDTIVGSRGVTYSASSFGVDLTAFGPSFRAHGVFNGERRAELAWRAGYYRANHHDGKRFDFDGRICPGSSARMATQPFIGGSAPVYYVPMRDRRPHSPYRLPRVIVSRFTSLLFGTERFPAFKVIGDPETQDFLEALVKAMHLRAHMVRARNLGGACGTVGLSWAIYEGLPRVREHAGENLHVHSWIDREEFQPEHVSELYQFPRDEWDPDKKTMVRQLYWHRRDWTPQADIVFVEQRVTQDDPVWLVDDERTVVHGDGFPHFVWIPNLPPDDPAAIDGASDYDTLEENFSSIDVLNSVANKGGVKNLDPTLVLKCDPVLVQKGGVRKGSDNALTVGEQGSASYLELAGSSITAGNALIERERGQALEVAQCVVPDPNTLSAAGTSSLAIRLIYGPMLDKADLMRETYGRGMEQLLEQLLASVQRRMEPTLELDPETGEEVPVVYGLRLPPRVEVVELRDEEGNPSGETTEQLIERRPGKGGDVELEWPDYFRPTALDDQQEVATLGAAAGGKPVMSHRSAVEKAASRFGLDPHEEWRLISEQQAADREAERLAQAAMFPSIGGTPADYPELESREPEPEPPAPPPQGAH
jgi:hypothetical protein